MSAVDITFGAYHKCTVVFCIAKPASFFYRPVNTALGMNTVNTATVAVSKSIDGNTNTSEVLTLELHKSSWQVHTVASPSCMHFSAPCIQQALSRTTAKEKKHT